MSYIELEGQSRGYSVTTDSITQTFVYRICTRLMEELDADGATYGTFFTPNDDIAIAKYVYSTFPIYRVFPIDPTNNITLFLTEHSAREEADDWLITLVYSIPPQNQLSQVGYVQFGMDLGGQTEHIQRAIATRSSVSRTGSGLTPPNTHGSIGQDGNSITGVDIPAKVFNFNVTSFYTPDLWETGLLVIFYNLISTYNNASFLGFAAGEVLLLSVSAQGDQFKMVPVTFNFSAKANANNIADAPFPNLTALGHDIIEYRHHQDVDADAAIQVPWYRYVYQVHLPGNFTLLGL